MGYRSEVAFNITGFNSDKEATDYLKLVSDKYKDADISVVTENITINEKTIKYYEDYIKWYETCAGYEFTSFVSDLFENKPDHTSYSFLRIGEDINDIEEMSDGNDPKYIMMYRSIDKDSL